MSDIQQARDVLAKWRDDALVSGVHRTDLPLIVGTAGNPDLLDALDDLLAVGQASKGTNPFAAGYVVYVERIAAAIIAADERMTL